jgi:hypothetical protein
VLDLLFAVIFLGVPIASIIITRSAALTAVLVAGAFGVSGVLLQFVGTTFGPMSLRPLQAWLAVTLLLVLAAAWWGRRWETHPLTRQSTLVILGSAAVAAVVFVLARLLAPGSPAPLSGVGYLIERTGAEDNAKWLNTAAQLAGGNSVDTWSNVGGPLVLVLVVSATVISVLSTLLYGGVNEVAVSAGSLILSEFLMVVVAPFAVAALAQVRRRWAPAGPRSSLPWPFALLSVVTLASGVAVLLVLGHLTLQYTLLMLTLWVSVFLVSYRTAHARTIMTIGVVCLAEVWFPLNVLAVGLLVALIAYSVRGLVTRRGPTRVYLATLVTSAGVTVLMFDFLRSSIGYALGIDGQTASAAGSGAARGISAVTVPTLPLFGSPGGTETVTYVIAGLAVATTLGAAAVLSPLSRSRGVLLALAPVGALVTYAAVVTLADFWSIGSGPNYASQKLGFAVALPVLVATLPVALTWLDRPRAGMTPARWVAVGAVAALLVFDTLIPRAVIQAKPALWPSAQGDPPPYWWPAEVTEAADQPLSRNPIGCVYLPQGAERPSVLIDGPKAYSCTRILAGLAGQGVPAAGLVQWQLDEWLQNESNWDHYHQYLSQMSPEVRGRVVIILDEEDQVIGLETLQSLLDRYPPAP